MSGDDEYGPVLPPNFQKAKEDQDDSPDACIGPSLPLRFLQKKNENSKSDESDSCDEFNSESEIGPQVPSHLRKPKNDRVRKKSSGENTTKDYRTDEQSNIIGPCLPPHLRSVSDKSYDQETGNVIGPSIPKIFVSDKLASAHTSSSESEDDELIGPMPSEMSNDEVRRSTAAQFEQRANKMKEKLQGKGSDGDGVPKRESWMTELPDCLSQTIGLKARTFRANAGPDMSDRSSWTDTPSDRSKKDKKKEDGSRKRGHEDFIQSKKDQQLASEVEKYNKSKRSESLFDMHQEKLQKKKKKEEDANEPQVRRPFDREADLQVNRFDEAQRNAVIKKSQKLDSRFSHGKSQFL